jgi:hypothetical protein
MIWQLNFGGGTTMALVRRLERNPSGRYAVHGETIGTYKVFRHDGQVYLQINTFGSQFRQERTHPTQTLQFGPEALKQLQSILEHEIHSCPNQGPTPSRRIAIFNW